MKLSDLDIKTSDPAVLLLQTPSTRLFIFLLDKMKRRFHSTSDTTIEVRNKTDLQRVRGVVGVNPPFSSKWFVLVDLSKVEEKDLVSVIKGSNTCFFFVTSSSYRVYKRLRADLEGIRGVYDYYINYLKRVDFLYLYDAVASGGLTKVLLDYVLQGYGGDVDAVLELFTQIGSGERVESRKDIAGICGVGGNSVESYIFSILRPLSGSDKGLRTVLKNRIRTGVDLGEVMGYSCFYHTLRKDLFTFIQLKQLMLAGKVYKNVMNLPSSYNEKQIAKYQRYIWRLREIPLSHFLEFYSFTGDNVWNSDIDLLSFLYRYYNEKAKRKAGM